MTLGESHSILYPSCSGSRETRGRRDVTGGCGNQRGQSKAQGSLVWETEGDIAAVTEMGNPEKGQLEKVIPSAGMSRRAVTLGLRSRWQLGIRTGPGWRQRCGSCQRRGRTYRLRSEWILMFIRSLIIYEAPSIGQALF